MTTPIKPLPGDPDLRLAEELTRLSSYLDGLVQQCGHLRAAGFIDAAESALDKAAAALREGRP